MLTLLMTSVSTLVGQEWLDSLEDRRSGLRLLGTSSQLDSPRNYRCDHFFHFPPTAQRKEFTEALNQVLEGWAPDLVLAGRDEDVTALANYVAKHPQWQAQIPCGPPQLVRSMQDKRLTHAFAQKMGLPWADSWWPESSRSLETFLEQTSWPVVVKPVRGFASRGIYLLQTPEEVTHFFQQTPDYLVQTALGDWSGLPAKLPGIPLSYQWPNCRQYNAQTVIDPHGEFPPPFCDQTLMVLGRSEAAQAVKIPALDVAAQLWCQALASAGARGCVNIQFLPDTRGVFQAFEVNLRLAGGTHGRRLMGFDEMGWLLNSFCDQEFINTSAGNNLPRGQVYKSLTAEWLDRDTLIEAPIPVRPSKKASTLDSDKP